MKLRTNRAPAGGFTVLELLLVLVLVGILWVTLLSTVPCGGPRRTYTVHCMVNLRQIGMGYLMFAQNNQGQVPRQLMATNSQAAEFLDRRSPAIYFNPLRPYVGNKQVWVCPTDKLKVANKTNTLENRNVSYFLSLDVTAEMTNGVLAGDRHLSCNGTAVKSGIFTPGPNAAFGWTQELHPMVRGGGGILLFADGHAQFVRSDKLSRTVSAQEAPLNHLAIP